MTDSNPYRTPATDLPNAAANLPQKVDEKVSSPAIALMIVTGFSLICFLISAGLSMAMLSAGVAANLPVRKNAPIDRETTIIVRVCLSAFIMLCQAVIFVGALNMKRLRNYQLAKIGAILSVIPCVGPCYLLGIPFGIWALSVLSDPDVQKAFDH